MQVQNSLYSFGIDEAKTSNASYKNDDVNAFANYLPQEAKNTEVNVSKSDNKTESNSQNQNETSVNIQKNEKSVSKPEAANTQETNQSDEKVAENINNVSNNEAKEAVNSENTSKPAAESAIVDNSASNSENTNNGKAENANNILAVLLNIQSEVLNTGTITQANIQINVQSPTETNASNNVTGNNTAIVNSAEAALLQTAANPNKKSETILNGETAEKINTGSSLIDAENQATQSNNSLNATLEAIETLNTEKAHDNAITNDLIEKFKAPVNNVQANNTQSKEASNIATPQTNNIVQATNEKSIIDIAKNMGGNAGSNGGNFNSDGKDKAAEIARSDTNLLNNTQTTEAKFTINQASEVVKSLNAPAIAAAMVKNFRNGEKSFTIRLDPPELGKIEIELKMSADKKMSATLSFDNKNAFNDMSKSMTDMVKILKDSGLDFGEDSIQFSFNDSNNFAGNSSKEQRNNQNSLMQFTKLKNLDEAVINIANIQPIKNWSNSRISIRA